MHLSDPNQISDRTTLVSILDTPDVEVSYIAEPDGGHPVPPETNLAIHEFTQSLAALFESYSAQWFPTPTSFLLFVSRISHRWVPATAGLQDPPSKRVAVRQTWRPERLTVHPLAFQITWTLQSATYSTPAAPGETGELQAVDLTFLPYESEESNAILQDAPRARARRKVRLARLQAAIAKLRAATLAERYYARYGAGVGETDSILSTDTEAELEADASDKNIR